jgi:hypothetical protein
MEFLGSVPEHLHQTEPLVEVYDALAWRSAVSAEFKACDSEDPNRAIDE